MKTLYTAHATTKGGRNGHTETSDGALKLDLATPGAPNAKQGTTNPEQLFASGYSACFGSAIEAMAKKMNLDATDASVTADISLNQDEQTGYSISATLNVTLPKLQGADAEKLVEAAHNICTYSKATRGNVDVKLNINKSSDKKAA